jgi:hypothetical protein
VRLDIMAVMPAGPTSSGRSQSRVWRTAISAISAVAVIAALAVVSPTPARAQAAPAPPAAAPAPSAPLAAGVEPALALTATFWALDWGSGSYSQIPAAVRYVGEHGIVYVHDGAMLSDSLVAALGTAFDTAIYPALTAAYGSEPNPGIDGEARVAILIYDFHDTSVDGSFNSPDIDPDGASHSNRREMFYLNLQAILAEPQNVGALAAHEFAHLIVHYRDVMLDPSPFPSPESTWLGEGFSTYAEHLAGYDGRTNSQLLAFTNEPNFSLTRWLGVRANYGASYSFMRYLAQREGVDFIRSLVEQPLDGIAGINAVLRNTGSFDTFDTLCDDWIVASFLDGRFPQIWPYSFDGLTVSARPQTLFGTAPLLGTAQVSDYGAVYLDFPATPPEADFQAVIDGADRAPLQAALISWDSAGSLLPSVLRFDLADATTGDTVTVPAGYDRHTLAVWARGTVGSDASYEFRYSGAAAPPAGVQFLDMGGSDPFYEYVAALLTRGVISGKEVPRGSGLWFFMGKDNVLRGQFAKMIMEATELHTPAIDNPGSPSFADVRPVYDQYGEPQTYPYDYVEEAAALGIVNGFDGGVFRPYDPITRGQLVLMITRGAAAAGRPLPTYTGSAKVFADVPVSHPLYREIMTAYTAGIFSGSVGQDGRLYFYPYSSAARNHVAKMTANLVEYLESAATSATAAVAGASSSSGS